MVTSMLGLGLSVLCVAGSVLAGPGGQADTERIDTILIKQAAPKLPEELTFRVRVASLSPPGPADIQWRYRGEGQGGPVLKGVLAKDLPIGQWTESVPVMSLCLGKFPPPWHVNQWFVTFTVGPERAAGVELEFEFSYEGRVVKTSNAAFRSRFVPVIGREVLRLGPKAEVLATHTDGGAAAVRHKYGKGQAYVIGLNPGLEYSATVRTGRFNMARGAVLLLPRPGPAPTHRGRL